MIRRLKRRAKRNIARATDGRSVMLWWRYHVRVGYKQTQEREFRHMIVRKVWI